MSSAPGGVWTVIAANFRWDAYRLAIALGTDLTDLLPPLPLEYEEDDDE